MKLLLVLALFVLPALSTHAQDAVAVPISDVAELGISIARLDSLHGPAIDADPSKSVFPNQQDDVIGAWRSLLTAFSDHLQSDGFEWSEPLRGYYRFYFRSDGTIDQVIYRVQGLDGDRAEHFGHVLDEFAQSYQFELATDREFAQCSPATLMPPSE
ncbi:MAG: hypothetical protein AAF170_02820 [Bacteroidota bacterium]